MSATQRANLLRLLLSRRGEWIPASEIAAVGGLQYGARLFELRHEHGYEIESRTERVRTGRHSVVKRSWFMLLTDAQAAALASANGGKVSRERIETAVKDESQPSLLGDAPRHRDEN